MNGKPVAQGRIDHTQCCVFSADEGADVGMDDGTPVSEDYKAGDNAFTGKIQRITIELAQQKLGTAAEEASGVVRRAD